MQIGNRIAAQMQTEQPRGGKIEISYYIRRIGAGPENVIAEVPSVGIILKRKHAEACLQEWLFHVAKGKNSVGFIDIGKSERTH